MGTLEKGGIGAIMDLYPRDDTLVIIVDPNGLGGKTSTINLLNNVKYWLMQIVTCDITCKIKLGKFDSINDIVL